MDIVLASSERFVGCLADAVRRQGHRVVAVISPQRGLYKHGSRGGRFHFYRLRGWDVVDYARRHGIEVRVSRKLDEGSIHGFLREKKADLLVLFSWPTMVSAVTRALFRHGALNIHPSRLPLLRGADPLFSAIDRDLPGFGISFHKVSEELDAGPIILQMPLRRARDDSYDTLYLKILESAHRLLPEALEALSRDPTGTPQQGEPTTVTPFHWKMSILDLEASLPEIERRTRACCSHHPRLTACDGRLLEWSTFRIVKPFSGGRYPRNGTILGFGLFSLDVALDGHRVRLGKARFAGKPAWATPLLLPLDLRKGRVLDDAQTVVQIVARARKR